MKSQYLTSYLDGNDARIEAGELPITVGTFINQQLRGRAKKYAGRYAQALKRSCLMVGAAETESKGGGIAYIRVKTLTLIKPAFEPKPMRIKAPFGFRFTRPPSKAQKTRPILVYVDGCRIVKYPISGWATLRDWCEDILFWRTTGVRR